jgi:peptidoglycan/LPS O-acetylase OafA/YrhL
VKARGNFSRNNLDCLRLILASIVALSHLCLLADISVLSYFNKYLSPQFAVKSFFVISGLLIYRSYTYSSSINSYLKKRIRRIYPAYFTVVTLAAIALCPLSILPPPQYFGIGFWKYLGANLLFLNFLAPSLPGVFLSNNIQAVNGALWTLKIEVAFYLLVPIMHSLCVRYGIKKVMGSIFCFSCVWKYGFALLTALYHSPGIYSLDSSRSIFSQLEVQLPGQLVYFTAGILIFLYFDTLKLYFRSIFCLTVCLFFLDHWFTGGVFDVLWISGIVFVFGFWRYLGNFTKFGDFSYGVYIVHFPILQTLAACGFAKIGVPIFLFVSVLLIVFASLLMWNLVEKRFLAHSSHYRHGTVGGPA